MTSNDTKNIKILPIKQLIKRIGPSAIISTGIVIGPGAITTAAMIGAKYGYSLIWLLIPIIFMGTTFILTIYRISMLTGLPSLHAIRKYYGGFVSGFVGFATFLSCMFFTIGNISGTGAGFQLLFNINWKIGAIIMICVMGYCYFSRNVYSKVEKGITLCIIGMIISFYITLIGVGGPDVKETFYGITHWTFPAGSIAMSLGFISTNANVNTGIYGTYLGKEKKWKKEDFFNGVVLADTLMHIFLVILISGAIMLVGAIVLFPEGKIIKAPQQLAELLVPILGNASKYIMGVALLGGAFSSLLGNTQRTVVLLNAGFDKPVGLENNIIKIESISVILICSIICFLYGGSPVQLIYLANVAVSISTPVAGLFLVLLIWRKDINEGYKRPIILQICMTISYLFALFMTIYALKNSLPNFLKSILELF